MSLLIVAAIVLAIPVSALALRLARRRRPRAAILVATAAVALVLLAAREPLGIDQGNVPDLVGIDECTATERLKERGLRWRFGDRAPVGGVSSRCVADVPFYVSTVADPITGQRPAPGSELEEGAVVVLLTGCTQEPHCAPGAYDVMP
ncbi:MAG TPA: PASTA domain-containing protein [Solirubrobacteraceae bacterium]|nr:PASTA domain-containing protein [Solirubrobacteraceae bacterium]